MVPHRLARGSNIWQRPEDNVLTVHTSIYTLKAFSVQAPQPHRRLTLGIKRMLLLSEESQLVHIVSIPPLHNDPTSQMMSIWTHMSAGSLPQTGSWHMNSSWNLQLRTRLTNPTLLSQAPRWALSLPDALLTLPYGTSWRVKDRRLALWQRVFYSLLRRVAEPGEMELTLLL